MIALADAGMKVGKVNSALKKHFEEVGAKMSKEWADFSWTSCSCSFQIINLILKKGRIIKRPFFMLCKIDNYLRILSGCLVI